MKGGHFLMSYIINNNTLALLPVEKKTKIIEEDKITIINSEANDIIAKNCKLHGSSLEGRLQGSSYLIGSNYKPPIIIDDQSHLILVPTHSNRNKKCCWIMLNKILNYNPYRQNSVIIEFFNHYKIIVNISYAVFDHQVLRATRLESALRGRNNKKHL